MKNTAPAIWIIAFAMALSLQTSAYDPLPSGCTGRCSGASDCMACISSCESYISSYADINAVRNSIIARQAVNTSGYDAVAVYNLEKCWCSSCCDYKYGGDSVHPCIYPCPCTIKNQTNNATTTTLPDKNQRPELMASLDEIKDSVNYSMCYLLNILWIVIPGISALVIMWAGSRYMASEEDLSKRVDARNIMIYSLSGLVLSLMACPAVDYLIVNTDITPFSSSCKCFEAMAAKPGVPPTLPPIANVTTQPFVQTTHGVPPTMVRTTTTKSATTSTSSTTRPCMGPCEEYKKTKVLPAAFDWRAVNGVNYMTPVRNQADCGSCWAHGAMASMEGTYNVEQCKPSNTDLSEQDLVSCAYGYNGLKGCGGGWANTAYSWMKIHNTVDEACFRYRASNVACNRCANPGLWSISGYTTVANNINALKAYLICHGPVAVTSLNWLHVITLAGWDDNSAICKAQYSGKAGCWIIKNSWGSINGMHPTYHVYHQNGYGYIPYTGHAFSDILGTTTYPGFMPYAPNGIKAP
ncbi:MAG: C1 family peptidase [Candidatus Altiarchaeia archaeon]